MSGGFDLDRVRRDTPSTATRLHLNNAGSSPMPEAVKRAVFKHLELETALGGYEAHARATAACDDFYDALARLLRCQRQEVAFAENATRAWDAVFYALEFRPGDRVLTCAAEYLSNHLAFLHLARTKGIEVDVAPDDASGQVSVAGMEALIGPRTRLIAMTHVPTHGGLVNPAAEVGRLAKAHGVPYLLDACQSAGQLDLDVNAIGCDFLSGTGRKFLRGPRGTGFLYAKHERLLELHPTFVDGHAARWHPGGYTLLPDARRFETWERNVAGQIGLAAAVRYALALGLPTTEARVRSLAAHLRSGLAGIAGVTVEDRGADRCGIVTFRKAGEAPAQTALRLEGANVAASVSQQPWGALDFQARGIESLVRLSVHYFNTEAEIERTCEVVSGEAA